MKWSNGKETRLNARFQRCSMHLKLRMLRSRQIQEFVRFRPSPPKIWVVIKELRGKSPFCQ
jgi:hypothetical protein